MAKPRPCQNMYPDSPFSPQKPDVTPQSGSSRPSRQSGLFKVLLVRCWTLSFFTQSCSVASFVSFLAVNLQEGGNEQSGSDFLALFFAK